MQHLHLLFASAVVLASCKSQIDDKPAASVKDAKPAAGKDGGVAKAGVAPDTKTGDAAKTGAAGKGLAVDAAASTIGFVGAKVSDDHEGKFTDFTGNAEIAAAAGGDSVTALSFSVKTTSIEVEPQKLEDHLRSPDFFDVEKFPDASFQSTSITAKAEGANTHVIEGTLDLHGVQKTISFPAKITIDAGAVAGKAEFTINRKDFGIVYAGMPDDLIKDEVLLKIDVRFPRS
jgi:polyisoprenoid-binding protein YceI